MGKIKNLLLVFSLVFVGIDSLHASPLSRQSIVDQSIVIEYDALTCDQIRELVAETYLSQVGVKETLGKNDSPEIREYLVVTGFDQPVPWCAAFLSWTLTKHDIDNPRSAWSPAWFPESRLVKVHRTSVNNNTELPTRADVFGVYFASLKRIAHVGFVDQWPPESQYFITVEGNTNDNGSREGDGVYRKRRLKTNAHKISRWISCTVNGRQSIVYST